MSANHSSCIRLVNAQFYAWHGVHQEEQQLGGKYEVDAELRFDFGPAAATDKVTDTVDYSRAYDTIREIVTGQKASLIESLAFRIAKALMERFPSLDGVTVKVRKRNLPLGGLCDFAEAEYLIDRS
ncbi:MAG: dihydroneopterin aldolase [Chlorobiaceae bacterium]|nr:dihydroneopterin aldolase [Chlorobiaceae bacterium]